MPKKKDLLEGMLLFYFSSVPDPRVQGRCKHSLFDIIVVALCGVACGCTSWTEIEEFANQRQEWLETFLDLTEGVPSHDTFARVFSLLDPQALEAAILEWATSLSGSHPDHISLDGKSVAGTNRSFARQMGKPLHLLNVFCHRSGMSLGQSEAASSGFGEIEAALGCLEVLAVKGALITVDAGIVARRVTDKIRERQGDYLVPVKRNHRHFLSEIELEFKRSGSQALVAEVHEKSHGRNESRVVRVLPADNLSEGFYEQWRDVKTIALMSRYREEKDRRYTLQKKDANGNHHYEVNDGKIRASEQQVYFISSRNLSPEEVLLASREHWGIENQLHWSLDVVFLEDNCRVRDKTTAQNLSCLRKIAFNFFKKCPQKGSMKVKMKRAAFNPNYLQSLLFGQS